MLAIQMPKRNHKVHPLAEKVYVIGKNIACIYIQGSILSTVSGTHSGLRMYPPQIINLLYNLFLMPYDSSVKSAGEDLITSILQKRKLRLRKIICDYAISQVTVQSEFRSSDSCCMLINTADIKFILNKKHLINILLLFHQTP